MIRHSSLLSAILAAASTVGSAYAADTDYLRTPLAESYVGDTIMPAQNINERMEANTAWWRNFGDPVLDKLISLGEANNYNAAVAARRIEIARRQLQSARSAYYPTVGLNAGWDASRSSGRTAGREGSAYNGSYFTGAATMNWEVDIFGKIGRQVKEGKAAVRVSAADYAATMLSLDAEIAEAYVSLLVSRAQLGIANEHSATQQHILDITNTRYRTGLVSKLDVAQARTLYNSTIAQIPLLEASIEASYNSIAVLLGTTRENLPAELFADKSLPEHYSLPALGTPLDLLRRRPDVVAAEASVEQAAAAVGVAKSDYLPSLSVSASIGTQAHNIGDLFSKPSMTYSIAPTLSWTLFDGFGRRAATAEAKAQLESAIDNYNLSVITAVEEVRTTLARYTATLKYIDLTAQVVNDSEESTRLSLDQYKQGLTAFYNVVESQLNLLTYQNQLVEARGNALTALIDLYKALGGGYQMN